MAEFTIDGTDFGIEKSESSLALVEEDGQLLLSLEVNGNEERFAALTEDEDGPWSWALYPPHFYLRRYPVPTAAKTGSVTLDLGKIDLDEYEVAIYMIEHNDVTDLVVKLSEGRSVEVTGRVANLGDKPVPFAIRWSR